MPTVEPDTVQTPRIDALPKVTGRAVYTEDLPLPPGTLYGHGRGKFSDCAAGRYSPYAS